jgi:adenylate cyclase
MKEEAMEAIRKIEQRQREEPGAVLDADLAGIWFGLGNYDKTFYHLNQCVDKKMGPVSYWLEYPPYREIKKDPRYEELKNRLNV